MTITAGVVIGLGVILAITSSGPRTISHELGGEGRKGRKGGKGGNARGKLGLSCFSFLHHPAFPARPAPSAHPAPPAHPAPSANPASPALAAAGTPCGSVQTACDVSLSL